HLLSPQGSAASVRASTTSDRWCRGTPSLVSARLTEVVRASLDLQAQKTASNRLIGRYDFKLRVDSVVGQWLLAEVPAQVVGDNVINSPDGPVFRPLCYSTPHAWRAIVASAAGGSSSGHLRWPPHLQT